MVGYVTSTIKTFWKYKKSEVEKKSKIWRKMVTKKKKIYIYIVIRYYKNKWKKVKFEAHKITKTKNWFIKCVCTLSWLVLY